MEALFHSLFGIFYSSAVLPPLPQTLFLCLVFIIAMCQILKFWWKARFQRGTMMMKKLLYFYSRSKCVNLVFVLMIPSPPNSRSKIILIATLAVCVSQLGRSRLDVTELLSSECGFR